jgi:hypothetical protein
VADQARVGRCFLLLPPFNSAASVIAHATSVQAPNGPCSLPPPSWKAAHSALCLLLINGHAAFLDDLLLYCTGVLLLKRVKHKQLDNFSRACCAALRCLVRGFHLAHAYYCCARLLASERLWTQLGVIGFQKRLEYEALYYHHRHSTIIMISAAWLAEVDRTSGWLDGGACFHARFLWRKCC